MSGLGDGERALIARHVLALRRQGLPAAEALALIVDRLEGEAREQVSSVSAALQRGEAVAAAGGDPLLLLLARGEAAGPDALEQAVRGFELSEQARQSIASGYLVLVFGLAVLSATLFAGGYASEQIGILFGDFGGAMPAPTRLALAVGKLLPLFAWGSVAALLAAVFLRRTVARGVPGAREYATAARLRLFSSAAWAGLAPESAETFRAQDLQLDRFDRALGEQLAAKSGAARAAELLAAEVEALADERFGGFVVDTAPALMFAMGFLVGGFVVAIYLPIFSIAGSVR